LSKKIELGCIGHFILADRCNYRRHTQVHGYRISTVGCLISLDQKDYNKVEDIGGNGDKFETMVFKTSDDKVYDECFCYVVEDWGEIECVRYKTNKEAHLGHERLVRKYMRKKRIM
jgi:hypothetical protein